jgi:hypothetical protein
MPLKMPLIGYKKQHFKTLMKIANSVQLNTVRTLNAQSPASLYCLPAELICHICQYLPIAETFCLMISCARFWHARTSIQAFVRVQQLLDATATYSWGLMESRFHILRLMEFDKLCGKGIRSFCCWACMRTHRKSSWTLWPCDYQQKPVNLKFSIEEQRVNCSAAVTRSCLLKNRKIWVGMCHQMTFAELRTLVGGMRTCRNKIGSSFMIPAGRCFSEHVEFNLDTMHLLSRFYLGRLSDLGLLGFDDLCRNAMLPICPHKRIDVLANHFLRDMGPGDVRFCYDCRTKYYVTITSDEMIELHISRYVGNLATGFSPIWRNKSYCYVNSAFLDHCRAFSDWLDSMYNPETGAVYNGGQFEIFAPSRKSRDKFQGIEPF